MPGASGTLQVYSGELVEAGFCVEGKEYAEVCNGPYLLERAKSGFTAQLEEAVENNRGIFCFEKTGVGFSVEGKEYSAVNESIYLSEKVLCGYIAQAKEFERSLQSLAFNEQVLAGLEIVGVEIVESDFYVNVKELSFLPFEIRNSEHSYIHSYFAASELTNTVLVLSIGELTLTEITAKEELRVDSVISSLENDFYEICTGEESDCTSFVYVKEKSEQLPAIKVYEVAIKAYGELVVSEIARVLNKFGVLEKTQSFLGARESDAIASYAFVYEEAKSGAVFKFQEQTLFEVAVQEREAAGWELSLGEHSDYVASIEENNVSGYEVTLQEITRVKCEIWVGERIEAGLQVFTPEYARVISSVDAFDKVVAGWELNGWEYTSIVSSLDAAEKVVAGREIIAGEFVYLPFSLKNTESTVVEPCLYSIEKSSRYMGVQEQVNVRSVAVYGGHIDIPVRYYNEYGIQMIEWS